MLLLQTIFKFQIYMYVRMYAIYFFKFSLKMAAKSRNMLLLII
jgi:hypothetical protein